MGMNMHAYRILGKEKADSVFAEPAYLIVEDVPWFNSLRFGGDKEFASQVKWQGHPDNNAEESYYRPADFEQAINWVLDQHFPVLNSKRLMDLLIAMQEDPLLYIHFAY